MSIDAIHIAKRAVLPLLTELLDDDSVMGDEA